MVGGELIPPAVTLNEAQAYVRIETGDEEAVVAGLIRTATALCEAFIGQALIARPFREDVAAARAWQRLTSTPVLSITDIEAIGPNGTSSALTRDQFGVDVDSAGTGWVRLVQPMETCRLRVSGTVGLASGENEVPEPIRQGVLRLVAHLYAARDGAGGDPPAAVTALWRPYRRMRLA